MAERYASKRKPNDTRNSPETDSEDQMDPDAGGSDGDHQKRRIIHPELREFAKKYQLTRHLQRFADEGVVGPDDLKCNSFEFFKSCFPKDPENKIFSLGDLKILQKICGTCQHKWCIAERRREMPGNWSA